MSAIPATAPLDISALEEGDTVDSVKEVNATTPLRSSTIDFYSKYGASPSQTLFSKAASMPPRTQSALSSQNINSEASGNDSLALVIDLAKNVFTKFLDGGYLAIYFNDVLHEGVSYSKTSEIELLEDTGFHHIVSKVMSLAAMTSQKIAWKTALAISSSIENHLQDEDMSIQSKLEQVMFIMGQNASGPKEIFANIAPNYQSLPNDLKSFLHPNAVRRALFQCWAPRRRQYDVSKVSYDISWDILAFLRSYYPEGQKIGEVLTISGGVFDAQSSSSGDYLSHTWPEVGPLLLQALEVLVSGSTEVIMENEQLMLEINQDIQNSAHGTTVFVNATAKYDVQLQVALALSWLCSAIRYSPYETLAMSDASIVTRDGIKWKFNLSIKPKLLVPLSQTAACWHTLFPHGVIAQGFPIRERNQGKGLEISFADMALLSRCMSLVEYGGGLIGQGLRSFLIPVSELFEDDALQWHFVSRNKQNGRNLKCISDIFGSEIVQDWHKLLDPYQLSNKRCFLGWVENAKVVIGTEDYAKTNADWSGAHTMPSLFRVTSHNITFGTGGLGFVTAAAGLNFTPTSVPSFLTLPLNKDIYDILADAAEDYILVYDTSNKRGWYLPQASVVLHMLHTVAARRHYQFQDGHEGVSLGYAIPSYNGAIEALKVLRESLGWVVKKGISHTSFADIIRSTWLSIDTVRTGLESIQPELNRIKKSAPGFIHGVEFLDVTNASSSMKIKQANIKQPWAHFAEHQPVILFCKDFGQPIIPVTPQHMCNHWRQLPPGSNYLAAMGLTIAHLLERHDLGTEGARLGDKVEWLPRKSLISQTVHTQSLQSVKKAKGLTDIREIMKAYEGSCFVFHADSGTTCSDCCLRFNPRGRVSVSLDRRTEKFPPFLRQIQLVVPETRPGGGSPISGSEAMLAEIQPEEPPVCAIDNTIGTQMPSKNIESTTSGVTEPTNASSQLQIPVSVLPKPLSMPLR